MPELSCDHCGGEDASLEETRKVGTGPESHGQAEAMLQELLIRSQLPCPLNYFLAGRDSAFICFCFVLFLFVSIKRHFPWEHMSSYE